MLGTRQEQVLKLLAEEGGSLTLYAISKQLGMTKSNTANCLRSLEGQGYIVRHVEGRSKPYKLADDIHEHVLKCIRDKTDLKDLGGFRSRSSNEVPPVPEYATEQDKKLSEALEALYERRTALESQGEDTAVVTAEIIELKRRLREGPELVPGDRVNDRYKLLSVCGRGGFATVWAAYDSRSRRQVALKILHAQFASSEERKERFFRGCRFMQRLDHPHIVKVLEGEAEDTGRPFFVMELLRGGNLWEAIQRGDLASDTLLEHVEKVAAAVAHAHANGVIHRDIKPANILLTREGTPKLSDFDLVRAADTTGGTRTGALGTFVYAAPEAMRQAQTAGPTADVYGLAMTALVGLTGRVPDVAEKFQPNVLVAGLNASPAVVELLKASLQVDPSTRPADAQVFLDRFEGRHKASPSHRGPEDLPTGLTSLQEDLREVIPTALPALLPARPADAPSTPTIIANRAPSPTWQEDADPSGIYADVVFSEAQVRFRMRWIEPGTFTMGSPDDEVGRQDHEGPQHQVTLTQGFWLADTPCTQAVYAAVMGTSPSRFKGADRPVEEVSWDDAQEFLQRINERLPGSAFMLPTEAQWEYAARAGTTAARYGALDAIAWYGGNGEGQTHSVKQKQPNAWGLYDTLGNVWEWTQDGAEQRPLAPYGKTPRTDPVATSDEHSGRGCPRRVLGQRRAARARGVPLRVPPRVPPRPRRVPIGPRSSGVADRVDGGAVPGPGRPSSGRSPGTERPTAGVERRERWLDLTERFCAAPKTGRPPLRPTPPPRPDPPHCGSSTRRSRTPPRAAARRLYPQRTKGHREADPLGDSEDRAQSVAPTESGPPSTAGRSTRKISRYIRCT